MSEYLEFYVGKGDTLIELNAFCRSSTIYQFFVEYLPIPYEKVRKIFPSDIEYITKYINDEIKHLKKSKKKSEKELKRLHQAVGDFHKTEEIHQTYEDISNYIEEMDSEIKQCKAALHFTQVLYDMVDSAKYLDNEVNYYVGVESGTNPEIENTED